MLEYSSMSDLRALNLPAVSGNGEMTRVLLLGVLRNGPLHGYAIQQTLREWHMDFWADVKVGSIYAGLKRLVGEGLLTEVGESRSGNRPVRMTYEITDAGRDELRRLLRAFWTPPVRVARPVDLALQFVAALPPEEVELLLEERLQALANQAVIFEPALMPDFDDPARRNRVNDLYEHERRSLAAEREWCEYVLERVKAGAYAPASKPRSKKS
jgi:DNA-binding PadR family transcriptional regulator